ncbi:MAG: proteasome assembly chaperone family protein [Halobacteriaceae archaeon]
MDPTTTRAFEFVDDREPTGKVLVCGLSSFGLAGLTAVDYLVDQTTLRQCGHVRSDAATITPFEGGRPRHPVRLFDSPDLPTTVLVSELWIPPAASHAFSERLLAWSDAVDIDEVAVLQGVPIPHGPEDHRTFHVATDDYREYRLADPDGPPGMGTGYLDGVPASLLADGMDSSLRVGVFVTPVHEQAPDIEAALRLIETLSTVYDLDVDTGPLEAFAADVQQYYVDLAARLEQVPDEELPDDRMYM